MNNEKGKMKNKKGITLIALVITIIILLILAGITISQLTGSGIFENAKKAREKWQNAQNEEEERIARYSNEIDSYVGGNRDEKINYSLQENIIGTYYNGKPIYQKCFYINCDMPGSGSYYKYEVGDMKIDELITSNAIFKKGNVDIFNSNSVGEVLYYLDGDDSYFDIKQEDTTIANVVKCISLMIQYTKTTDNATVNLTE